MDRILLTEAAKQTGIDDSTIRHWIRSGLVPGLKQGRDWWVFLSDIESYIEANGVKPRRDHKKKTRKSDPEKQG
jgi:excisionase family DNA binding protein